MLSRLKSGAPGAFKYENGNHRKGKQVHKPPENSCRTGSVLWQRWAEGLLIAEVPQNQIL